MKIYDCITFYDENLLANARFEILNNVVDFFIVCESRFDHKGKKKKINFKLINKKFASKVYHLIINEKFPSSDGWDAERYQREKIFEAINGASEDDYIMYSDSDEIPNPKKIKNFKLKKKYGIFLQKFFVYKINIFNKFETPWDGTRIVKKKDLKSFTFLRKKILKKNLSKSFWNFKTEKDIQLINNGGWHFNNMYNPLKISRKLKTFPHKEFNSSRFSNIKIIENKIRNLQDLFDRGQKYKKCKIDKSYPKYILDNIKLFDDHIL